MKRLIFDIYVRLLVRRLHKIKKSMRIECYDSADCYVIIRKHEGQKLFLCDVNAIRKEFCYEEDEAWNNYDKRFYHYLTDALDELKVQRNMYVKQYIKDLKNAKAIKRNNEWLRQF